MSSTPPSYDPASSESQPADWEMSMELAGEMDGFEPLGPAPATQDRTMPSRSPLSSPPSENPSFAETMASEFKPGPGERLGELGLPADFEVLGKLGQGGMGQVLRARQKSLDREVAVKVIAPELAGSEELAEALIREARLCARLRHPNIVQVYQADRTPEGTVYIAMELMSGRALSSQATSLSLGSGRGVRIKALLASLFPVAFQLCDALAAAHSAGVIHRDVKPANIQMDEGGRVRLLDFGVALLRSGEKARSVAGTPSYMAPEQLLRPEDTDHRCDIYAMGGVIFFLLTGRAPREAKPLAELVKDMATGEAEKAYRQGLLPEGVPRRLVAIMEKALRPDPWKRFASVGDMRAALERVYLEEIGAPKKKPGAKIPWKPVLATLAGAALLAGGAGAAISFSNANASKAKASAEALVRMEEAGREIERQLERSDLPAAQRSLLQMWKTEIARHQASGDLATARDVADYARRYVERERVGGLAKTIGKMAGAAQVSPELRAKAGRYVEKVEAAMALADECRDFPVLREEGVSLLAELQSSL